MEEVFEGAWELWLEFGVAERKLQNESDMMGRMIRISLLPSTKHKVFVVYYFTLEN